tara:strand:+ start:372 stop:650 length:279 start_codon:yes stop_codon:yes gene_type:complete
MNSTFQITIGLFLLLILIHISYKSLKKEGFKTLSKKQLDAINNDYSEGNSKIYSDILTNLRLPVSDLSTQNYCDARGLYGKICELKLIYANR